MEKTTQRDVYNVINYIPALFVFANSNHPSGELYRRANKGCVFGVCGVKSLFALLDTLEVLYQTDCLLFYACMTALLFTDCSGYACMLCFRRVKSINRTVQARRSGVCLLLFRCKIYSRFHVYMLCFDNSNHSLTHSLTHSHARRTVQAGIAVV